jgi:RNA polymerase sigma-70 factor (ECF subfamily)
VSNGEAGVTGADSSSDERLLTGSVAKAELFVAFYDRHARGLLSYFIRRTYEAQVAADLTAETFAQAFAGRARFNGAQPGAACAWLYAIARHQLSRYLRRQRVEREWRERLGMQRLSVAPDALERAEALIDLGQLRRAVAGALEGLGAKDQEALRLRIVEGRSFAEAARLSGCSEQALRQRVGRALRRLAADLPGQGEGHAG